MGQLIHMVWVGGVHFVELVMAGAVGGSIVKVKHKIGR